MSLTLSEKIFIHGPLKRAVQHRRLKNYFSRYCKIYSGGTILEVGCAGGQDTIRIAERFQARLAIGIDVQREYLATAQKLHAANNTLNFLAGDARLLPFPAAKFNACFMFGVLHYLATWPQVIREIARVLKPDGFYVFQEPLKDFLSSGIIKKMFPGGSAGLFTAEDFRAALIAEGFEIVNLKPAGRLALLGVACKK